MRVDTYTNIDNLDNVIDSFSAITLAEMDQVKLMNRTDRKYWFNAKHLEPLLIEIKEHYYILEIDGGRNLPYSTTYYDTAEDKMYINHHRGKLNRFKIRRRNYVTTQSSFLELKFKNNKGRTIKERISSPYNIETFSPKDVNFITQRCPYRVEELTPVLTNQFRRLMLVSREMNERCTIDQGLSFTSNGVERDLNNLVVVEVKSDGRAKSHIIEALRRHRLHPSGFSKYCIGRSITDQGLKQNLFKIKHRQIEKSITEINI